MRRGGLAGSCSSPLSGAGWALPAGEENDLDRDRPVDARPALNLYRSCMNDRLQQLMAFVRAAETASFSLAARDLGTSQPSVSRMVSALEERLGVKLLLRTTRRVTTTDAGGVFLERARRAL